MPASIAWIDDASRVLGVPLKPHSTGEAAGPCPNCKAGVDRCIVFEEGNYWCRKCHYSGFWKKVEGFAERIAVSRARKEVQSSQVRAKMVGNTDWVAYNEQAKNGMFPFLEEEGFTMDDVLNLGLGFCDQCPVIPEVASITFPVWFRRCLKDIRHRLLWITPEETAQHGKYRSHLPGLTPFPYNLDAVDQARDLFVIEGEKKAIHLKRGGFCGAIGLPGTTLIADLLMAATDLDPTQTITIGFDPGATREAESLAEQLTRIGVSTFVADLFDKPDDILLNYPDGAVMLREIFDQARRWN